MPSVKRDMHLTLAENSIEFIKSDCEKLKCFLENDGGFTRIDADEWAPQTYKSLPSSQAHKLNGCLERKPCGAKVSNSTDAVRPSGQIVCPCPVSQLHETKASIQLLVNDGLSKSAAVMDAIADFLYQLFFGVLCSNLCRG
ncbi:hypothetical protein IEQ34_000584 [Dendrobium chrysotoxum]|uniref:Uncharacterized protein n=1 Tax=Dendrobium chrysotoxum TaxID=161865 RepID=A0AAV7HPH0_DENCH|nr:hypothetical protein IEQ34_000584 [Dendrobium chrysotoxum]